MKPKNRVILQIMGFVTLSLGPISFAVSEEASKERVQRETREAVQATVEYTKEQREKIQRDLSKQINEIGEELKKLRADAKGRMNTVSEKARQERRESIEALEKKQKKALQQFNDLEKASGSAWSKLRRGMQKAVEELDSAFKEAKSEFQKSESE